MNNILIHATNIHGLGAAQVFSSFVSGVEKMSDFDEIRFDCAVPVGCNYRSSTIHFCGYRRKLPNVFSRFFEVIFANHIFPSYRAVITLGDIPLRKMPEQVVLVHQPHLIGDFCLEDYLFNAKIRINRLLFALNKKFAKLFFVQTHVMKQGLINTYGIAADKIVVLPHPPPAWFDLKRTRHQPKGAAENCIFFYPSAGYPHKNHAILVKAHAALLESGLPVKFLVTLDPKDMPQQLRSSTIVENLGPLLPKEVMESYKKADCLFFPSLKESYGLPLVEAMTADLPILCSDLPYARWLCEDAAIYFAPDSVESLMSGIKAVVDNSRHGIQPDWSSALKKIPGSWSEVARKFVAAALTKD